MIETPLHNYVPILGFWALALAVAAAALALALLLGRHKPYCAKQEPYECGFDALGDARGKFDVRFYLVAILFIVFDIEVAFLFPWAVAHADIGAAGFWSMMVFLAVLAIGFVCEWKKGALEWE